MLKIEKKNIKNKDFFYLSRQIKIKGKYKKIQVYIGKNIPNNLSPFYKAMRVKERALVKEFQPRLETTDPGLLYDSLSRLELSAVDWRYFFESLSAVQKRILMRDFAIQFIFESNSIEGSRLTQDEVTSIINKKYVKKTLPRDEVQEVYNSLEAFEYIRSGSFDLTLKGVKNLYQIITKNLAGYEDGYKTKANSVNETNTTDPKDVKKDLQDLFAWYRKEKKSTNPFLLATLFHNKFERIHPFLDGNGRTGRLILIWMLMKFGYDVILFKKKNRTGYFNALRHGDAGQSKKFPLYAIKVYRQTVKDLRTSHSIKS